MNRKESVAQERYTSPELAYFGLEPASLFLSVSINRVDMIPQVDEYKLEEPEVITF